MDNCVRWTQSLIQIPRNTAVGQQLGSNNVLAYYQKWCANDSVSMSAGVADIGVTPTSYSGGASYENQGPTITAISISSCNPNGTSCSNSSPNELSLPAGTETTVYICGVGFTNANQVEFGSLSGLNVQVVSDTEIEATTPIESPGTVDVSVTTPLGTSNSGSPPSFTNEVDFTAAQAQLSSSQPSITGISPPSGATKTIVYIYGSGFSSSSVPRVSFGSTATFASPMSDNEIEAIAPLGLTGTVNVTNTVNGQTSSITQADQFTYLSNPTVTSISPTLGSIAGGTYTVAGVKGALSEPQAALDSRLPPPRNPVRDP